MYQEILGKTDLNYLDVVIPAEPTESGNDFNILTLYWNKEKLTLMTMMM